jgi:hypothetical protein
MFGLRAVLCIISIFIIGTFNINQIDVYAQKIDPDLVDYHLNLAKGILETCYTRDSDTDNLIPNPTLPILSDLAKTCDKKMKSLDNFLAKFVGDKNGKIYEEHIANKSVS